MGTQLYFSGAESYKHWERLYNNGVRHILVSFFHLQDRAKSALHERKAQNPDVSIIADSGGFTFQTQMHKYQWTDDDLKKFLDKYLKFLEFNKSVINFAVEMDLEEKFGYGTVRRWQEEYFEEIEKQGPPIIYIWHKERGIGEWEEMCRRHRYVGVNDTAFESMEQDQIMRIAKKYLTPVHGFGISRQWVFQNMGLATADSVTWKSAERYGTLFTFLNNKLLRHQQSQLEKRSGQFRKYVEDNGGDYNLIMKRDYREFAKMGIIAHVKLQEYCDSLPIVDYYTYRLPDPDKVLNLSKQQVSEWAEKFKHIWPGDEPFTRFDLQTLSALQNGKWEFFEKNTHKYDAYDSFTTVMGESCPISFTNIDQRDVLRQLACQRSVPCTISDVMERRVREDFLEINPPKKRESGLKVRVR